MKLISLVFTLILCLPMSRDRRVSVSLHDILQRPSTIVVKVKKNNPFSVQQEEKVKKGLMSGPNFIHPIHHYKVEEILYKGNEANQINIGQDISVRRANFRTHLRRHKMYHLRKMRKSIYTYHYEKEMDITTVNQAIIYITYQEEDKVFEYVVQGAYDSIDKKENILNLLHTIKN
ncbi:hypothetical protein [Aquimarina algiphila]|uniref:hypothetical protein n=2 Tax=Aquimarina TaxID=290174 RepID=UPI0024928BD2|nr:hypothetical protein [Aquimarina algiphila]